VRQGGAEMIRLPSLHCAGAAGALAVCLLLLWWMPTGVAPADAAPLDAAKINKYLKHKTSVIIHAEKMLDRGDSEQAKQLLAAAVKRYPDNDIIIALYAQSLYDLKAFDQSERYFMRALRLNPKNIRAEKYIKQIRDLRSTTVSEDAQEWEAVLKDKIGDLIVFVLSIWLGTSLNTFYRKMLGWYHWTRAKRSYLDERYQELVRILEAHVAENEQDLIDKCLRFMLAHSDKKRVRRILKDYVIREDDLQVLLRSIDLLERASGVPDAKQSRS